MLQEAFSEAAIPSEITRNFSLSQTKVISFENPILLVYTGIKTVAYKDKSFLRETLAS